MMDVNDVIILARQLGFINKSNIKLVIMKY